LNPYQAGAQQDLVGGFQDALGGFNGGYHQNRGNAALNTLAQGRTYQPTGLNNLGNFASQSNPYINQQAMNLGDDISRQFGLLNNQIGQDYAGYNARGNSRMGLAQAELGRSALDQFQRGITDLRSNAYGMQQQGALDFANANMQAQQLRQNSALGLLQGIGQNQQNYFQPFAIGSGIIGQPSILNEQFGFKRSESQGSGSAGGFNIGFQQ
jgi:hypothetical protein